MANLNEPSLALAVATLETIKLDVAQIKATVEQHLRHKRKEPKPRDRETHIAFCRDEMPNCLVTGEALFDADGTFIGEIHHIHDASDARLCSTMAVSRKANADFNSRPMPRHFAETYQDRLGLWLKGPLFRWRQ